MNTPFFTIAIPAYKRIYFKEALDSCLLQTYPYYEVVIVNDDSPEDLDEIVALYSDERIHYYKNEKNFGAVNVVDNWNKCLEYAKGDYVICMGDDDRLLPNCLQDYFSLIEKYPGLGVYHTQTEIIDENSDVIFMQLGRPEYESAYSLAWHRWNGRKQQYIGDFCYNVQELRKNGGFYKLPLAWGSDDITAVRAAMKAGIANTSEPGFLYRRSIQTITKKGNIEVKLCATRLEMEWYKGFLNDALDRADLSHSDSIYVNLMRQDLEKYFHSKFVWQIQIDLKSAPLRIFRWAKVRKDYDMTLKELIKIFIRSLAN